MLVSFTVGALTWTDDIAPSSSEELSSLLLEASILRHTDLEAPDLEFDADGNIWDSFTVIGTFAKVKARKPKPKCVPRCENCRMRVEPRSQYCRFCKPKQLSQRQPPAINCRMIYDGCQTDRRRNGKPMQEEVTERLQVYEEQR